MMRRVFPAVALCSLFHLLAHADDSRQPQVIRDIQYARAGEQSLKLDLHLPSSRAKSPLILWVHGGAWRTGSKSDMPLAKLVQERFLRSQLLFKAFDFA